MFFAGCDPGAEHRVLCGVCRKLLYTWRTVSTLSQGPFTDEQHVYRNSPLQPGGHRGQVAAGMGTVGLVSDRGGSRPAQVVCADHASLPFRGPARGALVRHDPQRHGGPLPAHAGGQRLLSDRIRCLRPAGGERGHRPRHQPADLDLRQHRQHAPPAAADGRDVGLGPRGGHLRARILQVVAMVLPAPAGGRPRLP